MWIEVVAPDDAEGLLAEVYGEQTAKLGRPTDLTMLGSLYPELASIRTELYSVVESCPSTLTPFERQAIALAATAPLGSEFLTAGVESKFRAAGGSAEQAAELKAGDLGGLAGRTRTLAHYARLVATAPADVGHTDIEECRATGSSDLDILDVNNLASYYSYLARVCLGLGLTQPYEP